jgi:hypothetical protein
MRCSSCASENPEGSKFCIECAAPLCKRCTSCRVENLPQAKFCAQCGKSLTAVACLTIAMPKRRRMRSPRPPRRFATSTFRGGEPKGRYQERHGRRVVSQRGDIKNGMVVDFQVVLKVGFRARFQQGSRLIRGCRCGISWSLGDRVPDHSRSRDRGSFARVRRGVVSC